MDILHQREILQKYLNKADNRFINLVYAMMKADIKEKSEEIIGYSAEGKSLTPENYIKEIDEARSQIKNGKYLSQEELEKQAENW